jgi:hypothetical protein
MDRFLPQEPVILTPFACFLPLNPARILLQQRRPLLNWKYYDAIVGGGFRAREPGRLLG